jgi:preprotein translocase subunit SecF
MTTSTPSPLNNPITTSEASLHSGASSAPSPSVGTAAVPGHPASPRRIIDIVKYRGMYLGISALMLIPGFVFMGLNMMNQPGHAPVKPGIDFIGGTLTDVQTPNSLTQQDLPRIKTALLKAGIEDVTLQLQKPVALASTTEPKTSAVKKAGSVLSVRTPILQNAGNETVLATLKQEAGDVTLLQRNTVGPTLAKELLTNALLALGLAYLLITGYLTYRFQLDYAICALVALLHDTAIVLGVFATLGYLGNVAVDSLFITGILTVIGFSVHDTIVVFDRLRENSRLLPFAEIANLSVNQTLARSINTSMTALLPLLTLYFFGGESTKNLVLCMALGITVGTYSSIAIASLILSWWRERQQAAQA